MDHESDSDTNCYRGTWNDLQRLVKEPGRGGNWITGQDHPNYSIDRIAQNIEKSSKDLMRLSVTQTPVKGH